MKGEISINAAGREGGCLSRVYLPGCVKFLYFPVLLTGERFKCILGVLDFIAGKSLCTQSALGRNR